MKKILMGVVIFVLFAGLLLLYQALAQEATLSAGVHNAVVLFMRGDVKIKQTATGEWVKAREGMALYPGDVLETGGGSWVEIGVGSNHKNVIRIQENTFVELARLRPVETNLLKGELRALVEELDRDETFKIRTPMSVCGVRGTGWDTKTDGKKVTVDAYEGKVYFAAVSQEGRSMEDPIIKAGKRGVLTDPRKPITIRDLPVGRMRDWNRWKEGFRERRGVEKVMKGKPGDVEGEKRTLEGIMKDKVGDIERKQKPTRGMIRGKEGIFEQKDQKNVDKRFESTGDGY